MQEFFCLLTEKTKQGIENLNLNHLQEIRLRVGKPVCVLYCFENYFLTPKGLSKISKDAIVPTQNEVENTLLKACQHSLHTFSHQLSKGFLIPFGGLRIGVCGCVVVQDEKVVSIKEISSLNIRLPHEIKDCSKEYCRYLLNPVKNILIISPPGGGKTTFLRDLIYQTSLCEKALNVLVADERNEIAGCIDGIAQFPSPRRRPPSEAMKT